MVAASSEDVKKRDVIIGSDHYMICIGLCTHLGCIPSYDPKNATNNEAFLCACHGATYNQSGINTKAPAPLPMLIPEFKIADGQIIIGEAGPEYEKMKAAGVLGATPLKA